MLWLKLSLKQWQRRPLRSGIAAAGVALATAGLFSLMAFVKGYRQGMRNEMDRLGAHVLVVPKGCPYDAASMALHGASWPCYLKQEYLSAVRGAGGVASAAPIFMTACYETNGTQIVYVGLDTNVLALKPGWKIEGSFPRNKGDLLLGSEVARRYGWHLGQQIALPGRAQRAPAIGAVVGALAPTRGPDDNFIYLRLPDAQSLFNHNDELTHILVRLADPNDLDRAVSQLRGCDAGLSMNVVPLAHLFRTMQSLVNSTRFLLGCIAAVALLLAASGVGNAIAMSVAERRREIGTLRAIGASRSRVFGLVWLETVQTCLTGGTVGVLLAFVASRAVEKWLRSMLPFVPVDPLIRWDWLLATACVLSALVLGSLAAFVPAWRSTVIPPVLAMRRGVL